MEMLSVGIEVSRVCIVTEHSENYPINKLKEVLTGTVKRAGRGRSTVGFSRKTEWISRATRCKRSDHPPGCLNPGCSLITLRSYAFFFLSAGVLLWTQSNDRTKFSTKLESELFFTANMGWISGYMLVNAMPVFPFVWLTKTWQKFITFFRQHIRGLTVIKPVLECMATVLVLCRMYMLMGAQSSQWRSRRTNLRNTEFGKAQA